MMVVVAAAVAVRQHKTKRAVIDPETNETKIVEDNHPLLSPPIPNQQQQQQQLMKEERRIPSPVIYKNKQ